MDNGGRKTGKGRWQGYMDRKKREIVREHTPSRGKKGDLTRPPDGQAGEVRRIYKMARAITLVVVPIPVPMPIPMQVQMMKSLTQRQMQEPQRLRWQQPHEPPPDVPSLLIPS